MSEREIKVSQGLGMASEHKPIDWKELDGQRVWVRIINGAVYLLSTDAIYLLNEKAQEDTNDV